MRQDLMTQNHPNSIQSRMAVMDYLEQLSKKLCESTLCPNGLKGRPADIFAIMMTGWEMGLEPYTAIRVLCAVNGMASAYGDGIMMLVEKNKDYEGKEQWMEGSIEDGTADCYCKMFRKGRPPLVNHYSMADAKRAGLLGKDNWKNTRRMLERRAISYVAKDQFADSVMGIYSGEEAEEIPAVKSYEDVSQSKGIQGVKEALGICPIQPDIEDAEFSEISDADLSAGQPTEFESIEETQLNKLKSLIEKTAIPQSKIDEWLVKANVSSIENMELVQVQKCIDYLRKKELKNGLYNKDGQTVEGGKLD